MNAQDWQADLIASNARLLGHWVATTAPDKLSWRPQGAGGASGKSVLDYALECVNTSRFINATLRGDTPQRGDGDGGVPFGGDGKEAERQLNQSAAELADTVRSMDPANLGEMYETPFGPMPGSFIVSIAANHLVYHGGQVCYIQTLYGDSEFRIPKMA